MGTLQESARLGFVERRTDTNFQLHDLENPKNPLVDIRIEGESTLVSNEMACSAQLHMVCHEIAMASAGAGERRAERGNGVCARTDHLLVEAPASAAPDAACFPKIALLVAHICRTVPKKVAVTRHGCWKEPGHCQYAVGFVCLPHARCLFNLPLTKDHTSIRERRRAAGLEEPDFRDTLLYVPWSPLLVRKYHDRGVDIPGRGGGGGEGVQAPLPPLAFEEYYEASGQLVKDVALSSLLREPDLHSPQRMADIDFQSETMAQAFGQGVPGENGAAGLSSAMDACCDRAVNCLGSVCFVVTDTIIAVCGRAYDGAAGLAERATTGRIPPEYLDPDDPYTMTPGGGRRSMDYRRDFAPPGQGSSGRPLMSDTVGGSRLGFYRVPTDIEDDDAYEGLGEPEQDASGRTDSDDALAD